MSTTKETLRQWFQLGIEQDQARMVVWCDTFDHTDYPEYTNEVGKTLADNIATRNGQNMHRLMEVYDLTTDMETQLNQQRVINY